MARGRQIKMTREKEGTMVKCEFIGEKWSIYSVLMNPVERERTIP